MSSAVINKFNRLGLNKMFSDIVREYKRVVEVTLSYRACGKNRQFLLAHFLFLLDKLEMLRNSALRRPPRSWLYDSSAEKHMRSMISKLEEVDDDILREIRNI